MQSPTELALGRLRPAMPTWRSVGAMDVAFGGAFDATTSSVHILATVGARTAALHNLEILAGTGLGGKALALARPTSVGNYAAARGITHHYDEAVSTEQLVTAVAVPIIVGGRPRAVVYLGSRGEVSVGDRWFDTLEPLRRRLQHEILVEDEVQARMAEAQTAAASIPTAPYAAELAAMIRELGEVSDELGATTVTARLQRLRRRLDGGAAVDQGASVTGGPHLTRREMQVLVEAARGLSNRQIADNLGLLPNTVKSYLQDMMRKLDCANRVQAIAYARHVGWID